MSLWRFEIVLNRVSSGLFESAITLAFCRFSTAVDAGRP
jgi:hypothetical protein